MNATRPPLDGSRTDDIAMMSCPVWFEHGEPDNAGTPALGFYVELHFDAAAMTPDAVDAAEAFIENTYRDAGPGYGVAWNFDQDDYDRDGVYALCASVEFWANGGYYGDETLDSYVARVVANTSFNAIYNAFVLFSHAEQDIAAHLAGLAPEGTPS